MCLNLDKIGRYPLTESGGQKPKVKGLAGLVPSGDSEVALPMSVLSPGGGWQTLVFPGCILPVSASLMWASSLCLSVLNLPLLSQGLPS